MTTTPTALYLIMTHANNPPQDQFIPALAQPSFPRKWLLLLAGVGLLAAIGLIALGLFIFVSRNALSALASTPTVTATATTKPVTETPTPLAGVVIVVSATPTAVDTPVNQAGDTSLRLPTATRLPTNTPTPVRVQPPRNNEITLDGTIELLAPTDNIQMTSDAVEFKWLWHENKGCQQPPEGYAFEIRVWPDNDTTAPMGAMDARLEKPQISCDPNTGIRSFTIGKLRDVPGARNLQAGRLRWDVALVQVEPYQPIITTQYRTFFY
jgi:hypothetical protein